MIADHDRAGWFGASDARYIMGNWKTASWRKWWLQKLGLLRDDFATAAMAAGTYFEHAILAAVGAQEMDRQILLPELRLRVNLDGNTGCHIFEVKTHKSERFCLSLAYRQQVNVQLFAMGQDATAEIISYRLLEEDYRNFFREIDPSRLQRHEVARDEGFLPVFLPRLMYLRDCLLEGRWPDEGEFQQFAVDDGLRRELAEHLHAARAAAM